MITRSNRTGNRLILALVGLIAIGAGTALLLPAVGELAWAPRALVGFGETSAGILSAAATHPRWIAAGAALIIALALVWILSRGRGRTTSAHTDGSLSIDAHVVTDLLKHELRSVPDVISVSAHASRLRRCTAIRIDVQVRRGSDLPRLRDRLRIAIDRLDSDLGFAPTLLLHLRTGLRATVGAERRAI